MNQVEDKPKRTLKKVGDKYELTIDRDKGKMLTIIKYTKQEMRDNAKQVEDQIQHLMVRKKQVNEKLKKMEIKDTPKIREFLETWKECQGLEQKDKLQQEMSMIQKDLDTSLEHKRELKMAIPEFYRNKK